jgi:hypothetical protein
MLSMGNLYLRVAMNAKSKDAKDAHLKDSYKFFHPVLTADSRNAFAGNGLGVVCAEKGELAAAQEIFSKVRLHGSANKSYMHSRRAVSHWKPRSLYSYY